MTDIVEIDLPCWVMPIEPHYIEELELVILSTSTDLPKSEFYGPSKATRIIFYGEKLDNDRVKKVILSLIKFMCFLYPNHTLFQWLTNINLNNLTKNKKSISNLRSYISKCSEKPIFIETANYDKYPLMPLPINSNTINFKDYFVTYYNLDTKNENQSKILELIDFFSFVSTSEMIIGNFYNNANFRISNTFTIIESLINLEISDQSGFRECPECKFKIATKKSMNELIEEFIAIQNVKEAEKPLFIEILKKHYSTRNKFFHDAKNIDIWEKIRFIADKNNGSLPIEEEIKHANAGLFGLFAVNNLIRLILLNKLNNISD